MKLKIISHKPREYKENNKYEREFNYLTKREKNNTTKSFFY